MNVLKYLPQYMPAMLMKVMNKYCCWFKYMWKWIGLWNIHRSELHSHKILEEYNYLLYTNPICELLKYLAFLSAIVDMRFVSIWYLILRLLFFYNPSVMHLHKLLKNWISPCESPTKRINLSKLFPYYFWSELIEDTTNIYIGKIHWCYITASIQKIYVPKHYFRSQPKVSQGSENISDRRCFLARINDSSSQSSLS